MGLIGIGDMLAQYIEIKLTVKKNLENATEKGIKLDAEQQHSFRRNYDSIRTGNLYLFSSRSSVF